MRRTADNPAGVPTPVGRYSQVVKLDLDTGTLLVLSGQVAVDDAGKVIAPGDMAGQTERVFELLEKILEAHGATFSDVVNIRTYLTDITRLSEYAAVRRRYIPTEAPPASTTVEVSKLFSPDALVEVELTAATSNAQ